VSLLGLDFTDSQPDKAVVDYLKAMGANITIQAHSITIKAAPLRGIEIDMNRTPDALPAMAVTATFAEGETRLVNVPQARLKETDRIRCMAEELKKMNADVEELPDGLIIRGSGQPCLKGGAKCAVRLSDKYLAPSFTGGLLLNGRSDHRIVMALSIAGLGLDKPVTIDTAEAMAVTFPNYVELMTCLGAKMKVHN